MESRTHQRLACQVEVAGVLDRGAANDVAESYAFQPVALDNCAQGRDQQFLVAAARKGAVCTCEWGATAANHDHSPGGISNQHITSIAALRQP